MRLLAESTPLGRASPRLLRGDRLGPDGLLREVPGLGGPVVLETTLVEAEVDGRLVDVRDGSPAACLRPDRVRGATGRFGMSRRWGRPCRRASSECGWQSGGGPCDPSFRPTVLGSTVATLMLEYFSLDVGVARASSEQRGGRHRAGFRRAVEASASRPRPRSHGAAPRRCSAPDCLPLYSRTPPASCPEMRDLRASRALNRYRRRAGMAALVAAPLPRRRERARGSAGPDRDGAAGDRCGPPHHDCFAIAALPAKGCSPSVCPRTSASAGGVITAAIAVSPRRTSRPTAASLRECLSRLCAPHYPLDGHPVAKVGL